MSSGLSKSRNPICGFLLEYGETSMKNMLHEETPMRGEFPHRASTGCGRLDGEQQAL